MAKAVMASLKHYCSTPEKPQHDDCPIGPSSWCSYQRDLANGTHEYKPVKNPIAPTIQEIIQPIFEKLGDKTFLAGFKNLATSNPNESFHHLLWSMAPKEQFTSSIEIKLAMNLSVCQFNSGFSWSFSNVIEKLGLPLTRTMKLIFNQIDKERIRHSDFKSTKAAKIK